MLLNAAHTMSAPEASGPPRSRRPLRWIGFGMLSLLAVALLLAAGVAWQAATSSVSLDALRGPVERALRARLPADASVAIGSAALSYRSGQGLLLKANDVRLILPGDAELSVAELATATNPAAVFRRRIDLRFVTLSGVDVAVAAPAGLGPVGSGAEMMRAGATALMNQVIRVDELVRGAGLKEVVVRDAALRMLELGGAPGPALNIAEANWQPFETGRSKAWVQFVGDDSKAWDLTIERSRGRLGEAAISIEIEDLPISALAPDLAQDDGGPFIHSALTLQARMVAGRDGKLAGVRGMVSAASGTLSISGKDRIRLASAGLSFALGPTGNRLEIPSGEVRTEEGSVRFAGQADLREPASMTVLGRVLGGALPTGRSDQPSVELVGGGALARIDFVERSLEIERLHVVTPEGPLSAIGQASLGGAAPGLSFALSFSRVSAPVLRAFWPPFIASNTRRWFDDNVMSGTIGPGTVRVALPPEFIGPRGKDRILPSYALLGTLPFGDAVFSPLKTFPKVRNVAGELGFANGTLTVRATSGIVEIPGKGSLQTAGTILAVPELGRAKPRGNLHLVLSGSVAALAAVSDIPPLSVAAEAGIVADALSGHADLVLDANIPLYDDTLEDISPDFQLTTSDFTSTSPIEGRLIGQADLVLEGTPESFTVKGEGQLDGIQATVDLILGSAAPDQTDVKLELDDEAREKLGLGFGGMVTGPVKAAIKNSGEHAQEVALDLKQARISLASLGWEKGPGVPATAVFLMQEMGEETRITDLVISGKGFSAKGSLTVGEDGMVKEMQLTQAALRPGDRLSLTAVAKEKGYQVRLGGEAFDARGIIRSIGADSDGDTPDIFPIRIALDLASVTGDNDVVLQDISGSVVVTADGLDSASLKGVAEGRAPFEWSLQKDGKARLLRLVADDGGSLIRFAGVYGKVVGGRLVLDYSGMVGGAGTGVATLRDFRLLNETALAPALQGANGPASEAAARMEAGSGDLTFSQLRVPFRQQDWVIYIDDAALRGPILGATGSGTINLPGAKMAITGTFIPAFGLNNIAGSIPLIGGILGGGRDEGLVGITYKLFGPLDNPKLNMNPISAIAPGIFRRIFEYN